jgi:hypothetical protein
MKIYEAVLLARLLYKHDGLFFYKIEGTAEWLTKYELQKLRYVKRLGPDELVYSVPWYYGKECVMRVNDFNDKVFFDINEHEIKANVSAQLKQDYWAKLAEETKDDHWLTRSKRG